MLLSASSSGTSVTFTVTLPVTLGLLTMSIFACSANSISTVSMGNSVQLYVILVRSFCRALFEMACPATAESCSAPTARTETHSEITENAIRQSRQNFSIVLFITTSLITCIRIGRNSRCPVDLSTAKEENRPQDSRLAVLKEGPSPLQPLQSSPRLILLYCNKSAVLIQGKSPAEAL